ncbi:hypothetical protein [Sulfuricurvum sp.]|uniref:hypothetical protein n=1 Tax=Sulfuricurvum sp. TaxID=2025608 RepID=UPI002D3A64CB|nr:hypothetical protein [Sulfuricurvum sp.]HZF71750.1 hypothetical protein [Sulfuricurvum sp.]
MKKATMTVSFSWITRFFAYPVLVLFFLTSQNARSDSLSDSSTVVANEKGINFIKHDSDITQNLSIAPRENNISTQFVYTNNQWFSINIGSNSTLHQVEDSSVFNVDFKALYPGGTMGTYIGAAESPTMDKFVVSQNLKLQEGQIKLSGAYLTRFLDPYVRSAQKTVGAEYSYDLFDEEFPLQEIQTSFVYYDVEGKNTGLISDNNFEEYIQKNRKISTEMAAVLRLSPKLKAIFAMNYNKEETTFMGSNRLELKYRENDYTQMSLYSSNDMVNNKVAGIKYTHNFKDSMKAFLSAERHYNSMDMNQNICQFGLSYRFNTDQISSRLPQLFKEKNHLFHLTLPEITPINRVNVNDIM